MLNGRKGPFSKSILSSKIYECLLSFLILNWKKWINRRVQRSITVNVQWFFHVFVIIPSKTVFDAHRRFWIEQPCTISESHGRNSDGNVSKMKESLYASIKINVPLFKKYNFKKIFKELLHNFERTWCQFGLIIIMKNKFINIHLFINLSFV